MGSLEASKSSKRRISHEYVEAVLFRIGTVCQVDMEFEPFRLRGVVMPSPTDGRSTLPGSFWADAAVLRRRGGEDGNQVANVIDVRLPITHVTLCSLPD